MLEDMVKQAKNGTLQSLIGTGFTADGHRFAVWADCHENIYEMLGAIHWLAAEYTHNHKNTLD